MSKKPCLFTQLVFNLLEFYLDLGAYAKVKIASMVPGREANVKGGEVLETPVSMGGRDNKTGVFFFL